MLWPFPSSTLCSWKWLGNFCTDPQPLQVTTAHHQRLVYAWDADASDPGALRCSCPHPSPLHGRNWPSAGKGPEDRLRDLPLYADSGTDSEEDAEEYRRGNWDTIGKNEYLVLVSELGGILRIGRLESIKRQKSWSWKLKLSVVNEMFLVVIPFNCWGTRRYNLRNWMKSRHFLEWVYGK